MDLTSLQSRSEIDKRIFSTRNRQTSLWMIKSKLFFCSTEKLLKRKMIQIRNRNHKSLPLKLSDVHRHMSFRNRRWISRAPPQQLLRLRNQRRWKTKPHCWTAWGEKRKERERNLWIWLLIEGENEKASLIWDLTELGFWIYREGKVWRMVVGHWRAPPRG